MVYWTLSITSWFCPYHSLPPVYSGNAGRRGAIALILLSNVSDEKLRGGFYTPYQIADFILKWSINENENYDILEPSCGDGIFLKRIKENQFKYNFESFLVCVWTETRYSFVISKL